MGDSRNLILAVILSMVVIFGWQYFVARPQMLADKAQQAHLAHQEKSQTQLGAPQAGTNGGAHLARDVALKRGGARVAIDTPTVDGSLLLKGARFDDLRLKKYRETVSPKSPEIVLLAPQSTDYPYYAVFGWVASGQAVKVPDDNTQWKEIAGTTLSPGHPVTLGWDNGHGLVFTRQIAVDAQYMFTVSDSVVNKAAAPVTLSSRAYVVRDGVPKVAQSLILHEGFVGVADGKLNDANYEKPGCFLGFLFCENVPPQTFHSTGGWVGITDKYWMAAVIPPQGESFDGHFTAPAFAYGKAYQADYQLGAHTIASGTTFSVRHRMFAGAKVVGILQDYEKNLGIEKFDYAVDWGMYWFFTRPMFWLLDHLFNLVGNFGVAILLLTVTIKLIFFPLANTSYKSMSRMKKLQPKVENIRTRFAEDRVRQQQEMMELYKREKVNPVSGCLPVLIQIPVFFSLYKVLFVTIEMRHAPFFGWIHDLSAPDPTSIFNLFGLIPFNPTHAIASFASVPVVGIAASFLGLLSIGIWPILMGATQWIQTQMNPAPADPVQARMFSLMPIAFTFMLATFPAGLVIYWTWNNLLSVTQQYLMMWRQGVKLDLLQNFRGPKAGQ